MKAGVPGRSDAYILAMPVRFDGAVKMKTCMTGSLSLEGEGWGEGEYAALLFVPFTS